MFEKVRTYYHTLLPTLSPEAWQALEERFTVQHLKKGEVLLRQGSICRHVTFINDGLLRLYYLTDGREVCSGFVPQGEYISEYASFLTRTPAAQQIDALEDSTLVHLSFEDMQELYRLHPELETFGRRIAEKLFVMISFHHAGMLLLSPKERYERMLDHQPYLIQRVPQYLIASFIGITPEHLSRLRREGARKGSSHTS